MLSKLKYAKNLSLKNIAGSIKSRNYVTLDKEWVKIAQKQLKDTPAETLVWNTPEVTRRCFSHIFQVILKFS